MLRFCRVVICPELFSSGGIGGYGVCLPYLSCSLAYLGFRNQICLTSSVYCAYLGSPVHYARTQKRVRKRI